MIIGGAFGKIVSSLVSDVTMPVIGVLVGGVDFTHLEAILREGADGKPPVVLKYGVFVQNVFDFLIVATAVFLMITAINRLKRKPAPVPHRPSPRQEVLLAEIRDALIRKAS